MGRERRKVARHDSNLFAEVVTEGGEPLGRGVVTDVSLGGIAFETEADLPPNTKLICSIEIPLEMSAKVVRRVISSATVHRYGLQFDGPSFLEKFLIRRLLKGSRRSRKVRL